MKKSCKTQPKKAAKKGYKPKKKSFVKKTINFKKRKFNPDYQSVMSKGSGYIPQKDLTDPVDYASTIAVKYDSHIMDDVLKYKIEEARLLAKLRDRGIF